MRLNNVFYGFTKDGERKLLWKKYKSEWTSLGDVLRTIYYDLENKVFIEPNEVDQDSLVPITNLVGKIKNMSRRKVIKAYKADSDVLFDVKGAFYGSIVKKKQNIFTRQNFIVPIYENILFARIDNAEGKVQCVKSNRLYPWANRVQTGIAVKEIRPINKECFDKAVVTKKKMLELDYRKEL